MLKLGQYQKLTIVKKVEFGVYLAEEQDMEKRVPVSYTHLTLPTIA